MNESTKLYLQRRVEYLANQVASSENELTHWRGEVERTEAEIAAMQATIAEVEQDLLAAEIAQIEASLKAFFGEENVQSVTYYVGDADENGWGNAPFFRESAAPNVVLNVTVDGAPSDPSCPLGNS